MGKENEEFCFGYCGTQQVLSLCAGTQTHVSCDIWESFLLYKFCLPKVETKQYPSQLSLQHGVMSMYHISSHERLIDFWGSILLAEVTSSQLSGWGQWWQHHLPGLGHSVLLTSYGKQVVVVMQTVASRM